MILMCNNLSNRQNIEQVNNFLDQVISFQIEHSRSYRTYV